eukprot:767451-Hanusia_phi.AAC.1
MDILLTHGGKVHAHPVDQTKITTGMCMFVTITPELVISSPSLFLNSASRTVVLGPNVDYIGAS